MKRSWLIQRLCKPRGVDNPFAFGGGLKNGGLGDDAMVLLRGVFSFDYMGAAEFEYGAVPAALRDIARRAEQFEAFTIAVPLAEVPADWRDTSDAPTGTGVVYVLADRPHREEVTERITGWARSHTTETAERIRLASSLRPFHDFDSDICGWLELNNGFFFFTDALMCRRTADLFGVSDLPAELREAVAL